MDKGDDEENPFGYCGEYYDSESGLIYLRNRYYDSEDGRFISEDPAKDGLNWYVYCENNPVMFVDPSGYITQEEMNMYENGEMAPAAYTYLMNLTYQWYLADTEKSRAIYKQMADNFRTNDYKTTNGLFPNIDADIKYMPEKPSGWNGVVPLSMDEHYFRNKLNLNFTWNDFQKLNALLPNDMKWTTVIADLHQNHTVRGEKNIKYVSADGHFELIYNANNELLTGKNNADDMGTYNYYSPINNKCNHAYYDVIPYIEYGNVR